MHSFIHWLSVASFFFFATTLPYEEAAYPIDENALMELDTAFFGNYYVAEFTDKSDHFTVERGYSERKYHLTFWTRGGSHPQYEGDNYMSEVGDAIFLNLGGGKLDDTLGWTPNINLLMRLEPDEDYKVITAYVVSDVNLSKMKSSAEVRGYMSRKYNDPSIYGDTLHFVRIPGLYKKRVDRFKN